MLSELESGPTAATGADPGQLQLRKNMTEQLIIEESKHEAVEEEYFWPAVRERLPDGHELADEAIHQEQDAKVLLDRLDRLDAADEEFELLLSTIIADAREHIAFEETRVWPGLRRALSQEQADELGQKLEQGKKIAPTRPHPNTPPVPGVLKTAGVAAAAADRVRDAVTRRGD